MKISLLVGCRTVCSGIHIMQIRKRAPSFIRVMFCCFHIGASSDFDSATKIAKMMVTRFGMSEKVCHIYVIISGC